MSKRVDISLLASPSQSYRGLTGKLDQTYWLSRAVYSDNITILLWICSLHFSTVYLYDFYFEICQHTFLGQFKVQPIVQVEKLLLGKHALCIYIVG